MLTPVRFQVFGICHANEPSEPDASYGRRHVVPSEDTKYCFISRRVTSPALAGV